MKTVLHSDDINLLTYWQKVLGEECEVYDDLEDLYSLESSLIIMNYSACIEDCEKVLKRLIEKNNKILMLHRIPSLLTAKKLLRLGVMGYGNALMRDHFILSAIQTIKDGMSWLYPSFTSELITQLNAKKRSEPKEEKLSVLTAREKEVALLLKEGLTYKEIAQKLDVTPRTIKAHASKTYDKLAIKDRVALALLLN